MKDISETEVLPIERTDTQKIEGRPYFKTDLVRHNHPMPIGLINKVKFYSNKVDMKESDAMSCFTFLGLCLVRENAIEKNKSDRDVLDELMCEYMGKYTSLYDNKL